MKDRWTRRVHKQKGKEKSGERPWTRRVINKKEKVFGWKPRSHKQKGKSLSQVKEEKVVRSVAETGNRRPWEQHLNLEEQEEQHDE